MLVDLSKTKPMPEDDPEPIPGMLSALLAAVVTWFVIGIFVGLFSYADYRVRFHFHREGPAASSQVVRPLR